MKIRIQHRTTYRYHQPVRIGQHKIMIRPREGHDVHIESSVLEIRPSHTIRWMRDVYGNSLAKVDFNEMASEISFYSELVLHQYDVNPLDFILEENAVNYPFVYDADSLAELTAFMTILYPRDVATLTEWLAQFWKPGGKIETITLLQTLNTHINRNFKYTRRDEAGVQTPAETIKLGSGSCRDFATLMLEACRCWGLAARFVSGYMQCEATEAGGASTHAWMEVYLPGAGWKGFDPTSGHHDRRAACDGRRLAQPGKCRADRRARFKGRPIPFSASKSMSAWYRLIVQPDTCRRCLRSILRSRFSSKCSRKPNSTRTCQCRNRSRSLPLVRSACQAWTW